MKVAGIVLAAGRSSRMKRDKALIEIDGEPILARLVRVFKEAGLHPVLTVGSGVEDATSVEGEPAGEMIDSLARGIDALPATVDAAVIQPVDAPLTSVEMIRALTKGGRRARVLTYEGTPGHPVLVPRSMFASILARPEGGLRTLLSDAEEVPWSEDAILLDLDTPADLEALGARDDEG